MSTAVKPTGYLLKLIAREQVAEGTMAFRFEKPDRFSFKAGQFIEVTEPGPAETDAEGNARAFSIASAPHEETLMVATRMRSTAFKRVLGSMPIGTQVRVEGPFGNLVLHNNASRPAVLLAGGIGITPFRSMVLRAAQERLPHRIFLFYSNRRPEDAAFLEELRSLEQQNPNYTFIPTLTAMEKPQPGWQGETGRINKQMLSKYVGDLTGPIYYIAGPPGMVSGLHAMLNEAGIDDDDIHTEEFAGY